MERHRPDPHGPVPYLGGNHSELLPHEESTKTSTHPPKSLSTKFGQCYYKARHPQSREGNKIVHAWIGLKSMEMRRYRCI